MNPCMPLRSGDVLTSTDLHWSDTNALTLVCGVKCDVYYSDTVDFVDLCQKMNERITRVGFWTRGPQLCISSASAWAISEWGFDTLNTNKPLSDEQRRGGGYGRFIGPLRSKKLNLPAFWHRSSVVNEKDSPF